MTLDRQKMPFGHALNMCIQQLGSRNHIIAPFGSRNWAAVYVTTMNSIIPHTIHVCYIFLHLVDVYAIVGKYSVHGSYGIGIFA